MNKITVQIDNVLYAKESVDNASLARVEEHILLLQSKIQIHKQLVASGIFDKEFTNG